MTRKKDTREPYDEQVQELTNQASALADDQLRALVGRLSMERDRRQTIAGGLNDHEGAKYDDMLAVVQKRTGLQIEDVLAMIRAHVPPVRSK